MLIEMVMASVFWLNMFPPIDGVSDKLSPWAIVTGMTFDYNMHCQVEFGACAQTHEEHDNSMASRTVGAIALRPTENAQGSHYFLSLATGRHIFRQRWMELPMPQDVIDRVHTLAQRSKADTGLTFGWRDGVEIEDDYDSDQDSDFDPDETADDDTADEDDYDDDNADDESLAGVNPQNQNQNQNEDEDENNNENNNEEEQQNDADHQPEDEAQEDSTPVSDDKEHDQNNEEEHERHDNHEEDENNNDDQSTERE